MSENRKKREEQREKNKDELAKEEPLVLDSTETDPVLPAMEEYEIDEGGAHGTHKPSSGLIWVVIAAVAVVALCVVFVLLGDWNTPSEQTQQQQTQQNIETMEMDMGGE